MSGRFELIFRVSLEQCQHDFWFRQVVHGRERSFWVVRDSRSLDPRVFFCAHVWVFFDCLAVILDVIWRRSGILDFRLIVQWVTTLGVILNTFPVILGKIQRNHPNLEEILLRRDSAKSPKCGAVGSRLRLPGSRKRCEFSCDEIRPNPQNVVLLVVTP